jgi:tRNA modification GTPase
MPAVDRIVAVATPPGRGAVGIVRLSGPALADLFPALLGRPTLPARRAVFTAFLDAGGSRIDEGLAVFFPAPHSYTGEDVLELQAHGSPAVLALLIRHCLQCGARMAEPGEFTRRAYLNDRLDLVQAEAVADLISASTEAAARAAMRSLDGEFSRLVRGLGDEITALRVLAEACLDFPEEDVDLLTQRGGLEHLQKIRETIAQVLSAATSGRLLQEGARVVLCGRPNVGKSTLLNRLAEAEVAIVTDIPGTTRDPLREMIQIGGVPLQVIDTAGLRETHDKVERIGVERSWRSIEGADVALVVLDAQCGWTEEDRAITRRLPGHVPQLIAFNKADVAPRTQEVGDTLYISALDGTGMDRLKREMLARLGWTHSDNPVYAARERHLGALRAASRELDLARAQAFNLDLFAEHLRVAHRTLAELTGEVSSDDLLGEIFQRFCIGK